MAQQKKSKDSVEEKKISNKPSKFRRIGKYFLIVVLILGQAFVAYSVINKNYDAIYRFTESFMSEEPGKFELEEIIVNPANTNGQRYLLVQLSLELVNKKDQSLIEENRSKIRNNLIKHLSGKTVSELQGVDGKENLRYDLIKIINSSVDSRSVRNLYYSKYVMQ